MNLLTKLLTSGMTLIFATIGGLWTAFTVLNTTMDSKIADANVHMRIESSAQLGALEAKIDGVDARVQRIDGKLDRLTEFLIKGK